MANVNIKKREIKMKVSKVIARYVAKLTLIAAKEACGTASWYGSCQPKEPKMLKKYINKNKILNYDA